MKDYRNGKKMSDIAATKLLVYDNASTNESYERVPKRSERSEPT